MRAKQLISTAVIMTGLGSTATYSRAQAQNQTGQTGTTISASATTSDFHRLAPMLTYFCIDDVLYDRAGTTSRYTDSAGDAAILMQIQSNKYSTDNLMALLKDRDARVRTLAIAALYAREDTSALPAIAALADDKAQTYPEPQRLAMTMKLSKSGQQQRVPTISKTVGQVASQVIGFYMERAGYYYGIKGSAEEPGFAQYWQAHKDKKYCASWFAVKLDRASTGRSPVDAARRPQGDLVKQSLERVPAPDRHWILLWLASNSGFDLLANRADLVKAMRAIGPDNLMLMLQCKIPTNDPDLKPRQSNNYPYKAMQLAVLKEAQAVLKPGQVEALLACDKWERDYIKARRSDPLISPWWAIAAAHLAPDRASTLLRGEFDRLTEDFYGDQKADLAFALFSLGGSKEQEFLVNTFYDPTSLSIKGQYSHFRPAWLQQINKSEASTKLLKALVLDKRFANLNDHAALLAMADLNYKLTGKQPISTAMRQKAWHPLGVDAACLKPEQAAKTYPKETKELFAQLAIFRQALQADI